MRGLGQLRGKVRQGASREARTLPRFSEFAASLLERKLASGEIKSGKSVEVWGTGREGWRTMSVRASGDSFAASTTSTARAATAASDGSAWRRRAACACR